MTSILPSCPRCGKSVPFSKSLIGRGREFECRSCGLGLSVPKAGVAVAVCVFALLSFFGKRLLELPFGWAIVGGIVVAAGIAEYLLLSVRVAKTTSAQ